MVKVLIYKVVDVECSSFPKILKCASFMLYFYGRRHFSFTLLKKTENGQQGSLCAPCPCLLLKASTSRKINTSCCLAFNARMLKEVINTMSYHALRNRNITSASVVVIHRWI